MQQFYTWVSGGIIQVKPIPPQDPGESDRDYALRLANLIVEWHQEFPPDPR